MSLEGDVNQRLDQLDKRETELLKKIEKQNELIEKLKEDRTYYRAKCEEKEFVYDVIALTTDVIDGHRFYWRISNR